MTTVLAFDTSTAWCNVCVSHQQKIIAHESHYLPRAHSKELIPLISKVLKNANITFESIDRIATLTGPGSFTGLRVGLATAQGMSLALHKPVIGINAFQAYAHALQARDNIFVVIDTQKTDIYCQLLDLQGHPLKEPKALPPHQIAEYIGEDLFILTGDGAHKVIPTLDELEKPYEHHQITPDQLCQSLAILAEKVSTKNYDKAEPFYLNPPQVTLKKT